MYKIENGIAANPEPGTYMKLSDNEYLLITSDNKNGIVRPLRIKIYSDISAQDTMKSIFALTCMDYGSLKKPRIPVTLYYSDRIAGHAMKDVFPPYKDGNIPFWM
jgi:argonaute-like protein implicated in RNA metabolism and viral defense